VRHADGALSHAATGPQHVSRDARADRATSRRDGDESEERLVCIRLAFDPCHFDLLDEPLPIRVDWRKPVDEVVRIAVRRAVSQCHERRQRRQRADSDLALHILRLVEDQDRTRLLYEMDRLLALKPVGLADDEIGRSVERIDGHDLELDAVRQRKLTDDVQAVGVVRVVAIGQVLVQVGEMLLRDRERFQYAFANGDRGDDDDELSQAVTSAQLECRPEIDVRLARTGFHLDGEVREAPTGRTGDCLDLFLDHLQLVVLV